MKFSVILHLTIVYTIKEFQPFGDTFDETYKFVGPSISAQMKNRDVDFTSIEEKVRFIFH